MKDQRSLSNKKSRENLTAPHNFRPGSDEKIALLRERAKHGKPLFVEGEPHVYSSPETSLLGFLRPPTPSLEQVEDTQQPAAPTQSERGKRSRAGASLRRSASFVKPAARTERGEYQSKSAPPHVPSWGSESLVMPKTESIPADVLMALQLLAQSPNSAITGAHDMLAEIKGKQEEHANASVIVPAA